MSIPGCELLHRIGEGGIADVFAANWRGQLVAVKVLREPERRSLRRRFLREGRLLERYTYPGLVRCLSVYTGERGPNETEAEAGNNPALILELLHGETLDLRVRRRPMSAAEGERLAASLLRTLSFLHQQGIVHRDVKANNIFLCDDGRIVLMDLGLAADPADPATTTLGDIMGTHAYMAPEQIAGGETDHRCDLYSLGITLYEALSGHRPYEAQGLAGYLAAHRAGNATPLSQRVPNLPYTLVTLVHRLMARDPSARPASAMIALALLTGKSLPGPTLAPPPVIGREGVRGAIEATLDGGGVLRIWGAFGSGLGAVARMAVQLATELGVEYLALRCRDGMTAQEALTDLARSLEPFATTRVHPTADAVRRAIDDMCQESDRFLLLVEDLSLATPGVAELLAYISTIEGLATVLTSIHFGSTPPGRDLHLRPLRLEEAQTLVSTMLGTPHIPPGIEVELHQQSGGLPALLVALLREHVARGTVWCEGLGEQGFPLWRWDATILPPLTPELSAETARTVEALPEPTRQALYAIAAGGGRLPMDILVEASGIDPSGVDLAPLARQGIVRVDLIQGEEWVQLRRAIIQKLVLSLLPPDRRKTLHRTLAQAVHCRPMDDWSRRFLVTQSALGADGGRWQTELLQLTDFLLESGRPIEALETLAHFQDHPLDTLLLPRFLLSRTDAYLQLNRLVEADESYQRLIRAGNSLEERALLTEIELRMQQGMRCERDIDRILSQLHTPLARLLSAERLWLAGQVDDAMDAMHTLVLSIPRGPLDYRAVQARLRLSDMQLRTGQLDDAAAALRRIIVELRTIYRPNLLIEALCLLTKVYRDQGRLAAALEQLHAAEEAAAVELPFHRIQVGLTRATVLLSVGAYEEVGRLLTRHASGDDPTHPYALRLLHLDTLARLRFETGDQPAALATHMRAADIAIQASDRAAHAFHTGMAAIITADAEGVATRAAFLATTGLHRLLARLFAVGARIGRDPELLLVAESEARASGDQLQLLALLYADHGPGAQAEAAAICQHALEGLHNPLRQVFVGRPEVRWALRS